MWKIEQGIISEDIWSWALDKIIKPVGGTLEGIGNTITSLGKGDLKGVGAGLQKTIKQPVKLVANVVKAPVDAIDAGINLCKKAPESVKQSADKISDDDAKKAIQQNAELKKKVEELKLDLNKQKLLLAATGTIQTIKRAVKTAKKNSTRKVKLSPDESKMLKILVSAMGDEKKARADFTKQYEDGKIAIWNSQENAIQSVSKEEFIKDPNKYIEIANKHNKNATGSVTAATELNEKQKVMLNILKSALGEGKQKEAEQRFMKALKQKKIAFYNNSEKKIKTIPLEKLENQFDTVRKYAEKNNPNNDSETASMLDEDKLEDYYTQQHKQTLAHVAKKKVERIETAITRKTKKSQVYVLDENNKLKPIKYEDFVKNQDQYEKRLNDLTNDYQDFKNNYFQKSIPMLAKAKKMKEERFKAQAERYFTRNKVYVLDKDGKVVPIDFSEYNKNRDEYINKISDHDQANDDAAAASKGDLKQLKKEAKEYHKAMQTTDMMNEIASVSDRYSKTNHYWLNPQRYVLYDINNKRIGAWPGGMNIGRDKLQQHTDKFINFLNCGEDWKNEQVDPPHPMAMYQILSTLAKHIKDEKEKAQIDAIVKGPAAEWKKIADKFSGVPLKHSAIQ